MVATHLKRDNCHIYANSIIKDSHIDQEVSIGPFTRIRPQSHLKENTKVGNFVEIKKSIVGSNSKINHLSYIGDSQLGTRVNVGAGVITCNYDGKNKQRTYIDDNTFIGSNSALIAPVSIGKNAFIGAGSTITRNVSDNELGISRNKQTNLKNHKR